MNKTIALLLSATVIVVVAILVISIASSSFAGLDRDTENIKETGKCQYQANQAGEPGEVDRECIPYIEDSDRRDQAIASSAGVPVR